MMYLPAPESCKAFWLLLPIIVITACSLWDFSFNMDNFSLSTNICSIYKIRQMPDNLFNKRHSLSGFKVQLSGLERSKLFFGKSGVGIFSSSKCSSKSEATEHSESHLLHDSNSCILVWGFVTMFPVMTHRVLVVPVISFQSMVSMTSLVIMAGLMGLTVFMVGGVPCCLVANRICCILFTVLAIPFVNGKTGVLLMP